LQQSLREHSAPAAKVANGVTEFEIYIKNNSEFIPNLGDRWRQGERISTAFVESTINQVVSRRFVKKQQMQWSLKARISCFRHGPRSSTMNSMPHSDSGIRSSDRMQLAPFVNSTEPSIFYFLLNSQFTTTCTFVLTVVLPLVPVTINV
jgi:hypothetical protein